MKTSKSQIAVPQDQTSACNIIHLPHSRHFRFALPSVEFHHTEQTIIHKWATIKLVIPVADMRDAEACWSKSFNDSQFRDNPIATSISISSDTRDNCRWLTPFNKGRKGLPSLKKRLENIRKDLKSQPCREIEVTMHQSIWERVLVVSRIHGITAFEHCLGAISYHAYCWRCSQPKPKPGTSFDAFEQGLAKEDEQAKADKRFNLGAGGSANRSELKLASVSVS
jgi:hypothetical protein